MITNASQVIEKDNSLYTVDRTVNEGNTLNVMFGFEEKKKTCHMTQTTPGIYPKTVCFTMEILAYHNHCGFSHND